MLYCQDYVFCTRDHRSTCRAGWDPKFLAPEEAGSQPYTLFKFSENQYEIKDILDRREFLGIALLDPPL